MANIRNKSHLSIIICLFIVASLFASIEFVYAAEETDSQRIEGKLNGKLVTNPIKKPIYARMMFDIKLLKRKYPNIISYSYIGESAAGVKIPLVKLGNGPNKILITASIHAREYVVTSQVMTSIDVYSLAYANNKKINGENVKDILDNKVTYYFVPMVNPDGVAIATGRATEMQKELAVKAVGENTYKDTFSDWKGNANAVNLNRNFPIQWSGGESQVESEHYRGESSASEPETKALMKLCNENDFTMILSAHTKGEVIYWDEPVTATIPGAKELADAIQRTTDYPLTVDTDYNSGFFEVWFRFMFNRPAAVIEMTPMEQDFHTANKNFNASVWDNTKFLWLKVAEFAAITNKYKIHFNDSEGKTATVSKNVTYGKPVGKLPSIKRDGYVFTGWYTKKSGGKKISASSIYQNLKNQTVYARWKKIIQ